jgi:UDP-glucose 4-epimerase
MTWLVTGGAGYIGSHTVHAMVSAGHQVVVLDDLSTGHAARIPAGVEFVQASILDQRALDRVIRDHRILGVVHFAARKQVEESVRCPLLYYESNLHGLQNVLQAAVDGGVRRFVFSSSAAVYGMPDVEFVGEETPCVPINPYGQSKLAGEWMVRSVGAAHGISTVCLRYFNVAGAASPLLADDGVSNLVPMVFERLDSGNRPVLFGDDYPTVDGSCVRDFIHVVDVASAHVAAAGRLTDSDPHPAFVLNIGRGEGVSVLAMLEVIARVTRRDTTPQIAPRRAGDPARVVASAERIRTELGWTARHGVDEMISTAWNAWQARRGAE